MDRHPGPGPRVPAADRQIPKPDGPATADGTEGAAVRLCLEALNPLVTDDAIVWAIRRAQAHPWQAVDAPA